jgi:actin related protein 2/3 complex subunit 4
VKIKQLDNVDILLAKMFMRFLAQRADQFRILRRKPVPGYDISFLVTNIHANQIVLPKLINFIVTFLQDVDKELSDMKVTLKAQVRRGIPQRSRLNASQTTIIFSILPEFATLLHV